jgi:hypothetical protein
MRAAALALAAGLLLPLAAAAQTERTQTERTAPVTPEAVLERFTKLVDRGEARSLFGLPLNTFWRREGTLAVGLLAEDFQALQPVLEGATAPFAAVSGRRITVVEAGPAEIAGHSAGELAPEADLVIIIAPRPALAEFAAAGAFSKGMLARFELGSWPFMFRFQPDSRRRGLVLLADDEPAQAREATFILATVWALGGVTLGPELTGLVSDSATGPQLTPLGQAVFRLLFHEDLEVGMPIADAVQRAKTLLPQ